ncbi:hypothetical protein P168DRAFT_95992 [Aspergillus campestris IBT 28561]|uniref:Uncharacterized protein n=1 Tax=Aspergillus campestris (strain IBT 28561) TaxID=1392248 RepID=A0A2I1DC40_ASPC2|nr:uncharacterized protein P168DRAFT_95992 [Aspergillus campestris IBT 28561]PKY07431.1 hypothetical protein P168DRAFT_95992 [Aspergillus campestris IBT 28561]
MKLKIEATSAKQKEKVKSREAKSQTLILFPFLLFFFSRCYGDRTKAEPETVAGKGFHYIEPVKGKWWSCSDDLSMTIAPWGLIPRYAHLGSHGVDFLILFVLF